MSISIVGSLIAIATYFSLYYAHNASNKLVKINLHGVFIFLAALLTAHMLPGFDNIKLIDAVKFSQDSSVFSMYLNFDKATVAVVILLILGFGSVRFNISSILKSTVMALLPCWIVVISLAYLMGYIKYDYKFPAETFIWAANNLFIVCIAEEAFFRRYLQGGLTQLLEKVSYGKYIALVVCAALFGLAHIQGGISYVILSTVAGLFYGYAYMRSNRLEPAVLTHFGLNMVHFIFFSYPALA